MNMYHGEILPSISTGDVDKLQGVWLQRRAAEIVSTGLTPHPELSTYRYKKGTGPLRHDESVKLDWVIRAMVIYAPRIGGDKAVRYTASAIQACTRFSEPARALANLAITWLTHFIFIRE